MKGSEFGFVLLRLAALYLGIQAGLGLIASIGYLGYVETGDRWAVGGAQLLLGLAVVALAAYLFVRARTVAGRLFGSLPDDEVSAPANTLHAVGLSLIGAFVLATALPPLGGSLFSLLWSLRAGAELELDRFASPANLSEVIRYLLAAAIGAFLFARSGRLVELGSSSR